MIIPEILVTGADGQLGRSIRKIAGMLPAAWTFATRQQLDISDPMSIEHFLSGRRFDYCINTAAYTRVDQAEQEKELAYKINAEGVRLLAEACGGQRCAFIHISSDYVYHNGLARPLREDDPLSPASVYACSKQKGEENALDANPRTVVLRTSWLFSEFGHNFVKTIARLIQEGKSLRIVDDQIGCPTYAGDLAQAILRIISTLLEDDSRSELFGIFNYCNKGSTTWYAFACEIARSLGIEADISPVSTAVYGAPAARPLYSVLDTSKIETHFGLTIPRWADGLQLTLNEGC